MKMPLKRRQVLSDGDGRRQYIWMVNIPATDSNESPLVLLHRGPADFVEYALQSLRLCHPDRRIILIGDDYHRYDASLNIEYRQWSRYNAGAKHLAQIYRHQSENKYAFELLCLGDGWSSWKSFVGVRPSTD